MFQSVIDFNRSLWYHFPTVIMLYIIDFNNLKGRSHEEHKKYCTYYPVFGSDLFSLLALFRNICCSRSGDQEIILCYAMIGGGVLMGFRFLAFSPNNLFLFNHSCNS